MRRFLSATLPVLAAVLLLCCPPARACLLPFGAAQPWLAQPRLDRAGRGDPAWLARAMELKGIAHRQKSEIVFVGDSITAGWLEQGAPVWQAHFAAATNLGLPGDTTQNLLARIEGGLLDAIHPRLIFLLIGTNDISRSDQIGCWSARDIRRGILAAESAIKTRVPTSTVVVVTLPPNFGSGPASPFNQLVDEVNAGLGRPVVDINAVLARAVATRRVPPVLDRDGIHLTEAGYRLVEPLFWNFVAGFEAQSIKR